MCGSHGAAVVGYPIRSKAYEASGRAERELIDTPDRHDIDAEIELAEIVVV